MGVRFYDDALTEKIKYWTSKTDLRVYSPTETRQTFEAIAATNNDAPIQLPLITITRPKNFEILNPNKGPLTYDGKMIDATIDKSLQIDMIPIKLKYQLDIYTREYAEADEYVSKFIFNITNFPSLDVVFPYEDIEIVQDSNLHLITEIEDNSDIPERLIPGQFTRMSIGVEVDDAKLFNIRTRDNCFIVVNDLE